MRQVTAEMARAFMAKTPRTIGNTHTDGITLSLHGNAIARHTADGIIFTMAGWPTVTTRERLNALPAVHVYQRDGEQYCNGYRIDVATWYRIADDGTAQAIGQDDAEYDPIIRVCNTPHIHEGQAGHTTTDGACVYTPRTGHGLSY